MVYLRNVCVWLRHSFRKQYIFQTNPAKYFVRLTDSRRYEIGYFRFFSTGSIAGSVGGLFEKWHRQFTVSMISEPDESIRYILAFCLETEKLTDVDKSWSKVLDASTVEKIEDLCRKRLKRIPLQYLLGVWPFRNLQLTMVPPVFIPRPETEQLIDIVLKGISHKQMSSVLDLCCGSGAISLSLLDECSSIKAVAVDQSVAACELTKANAQKNGLNRRIRVIVSELDGLSFEETFDLIVSNPPYVFSEDLANLQPEIKLYEDLRALDGGIEGLDVINTILKISSRHLAANGKLFMEVEPRHPKLLRNFLEKNRLGLAYTQTHQDLYGKERFVEITRI